MKAEMKAIVASIVVIALALTAVSGVTYSWFSDEEKSTIDVDTATVDVKGQFDGTANVYKIDGSTKTLWTGDTAATLSSDGESISISNLVGNRSIEVNYRLTNLSSIITTYRMYVQLDGLTDLSKFSMVVNQTGTSTLSPASGAAAIEFYNGIGYAVGTATEGAALVKADLPGGTEYEFSMSIDFGNYDSSDLPTSFSIKIVNEAYQSDYTFSSISVLDGGKVTLPASTASTGATVTGVAPGASSGTVGASITVNLSAGAMTKATDAGTKDVELKAEMVSTTSGVATLSLGFTASTVETDFGSDKVTVTITISGTYTSLNVVFLGTEMSQPSDIKMKAQGGNTIVTFTTTHFSDFLITSDDIVAVVDTDSGVQPFTKFGDALNSVSVNGTIRLLSDVTYNNLISVSKSFDIELNSQKLEIYRMEITSGASLVLKDGEFSTSTSSATNAGVDIQKDSSIELLNVKYDAVGSGLFPHGNAASVTVTDSLIVAHGVYAVGTNARGTENYGVVISISGSDITATTPDFDNTAVMINVEGKLIISDSKIKADRQCLIVRAGHATVTDTEFTYTNAFFEKNGETRTAGWDTGNEVSASAIVVGNLSSTAYLADAVLSMDSSKIACGDNAKTLVVAQSETGSNGKTASVQIRNSPSVTANAIAKSGFGAGDESAIDKDTISYSLPMKKATSADEIKSAISSVPDSGSVSIDVPAGEFDLSSITFKPNTMILIKGSGDDTKFDFTNITSSLQGSDASFKNIQITYGAKDYKGLQHAGNVVYENCTFNGKMFLYGESVTFINCEFNSDVVDYCVWTYGAKEVTFDNCTFECKGKAVLIYNEGNGDGKEHVVTFNECKFNAESKDEGKAAIEVDSALLKEGMNFTVNINDCTQTGFDNGSVSGDPLWNEKKHGGTTQGTHASIYVDEKLVWSEGKPVSN